MYLYRHVYSFCFAKPSIGTIWVTPYLLKPGGAQDLAWHVDSGFAGHWAANGGSNIGIKRIMATTKWVPSGNLT